MHLTRFTIYSESEGDHFRVELTPEETRFVMAHVTDYNTLSDYLHALPEGRIIEEETP